MSLLRWFLGLTLALGFSLLTLLLVARERAATAEESLLPARRQLVAALGLSDMALWSEARYTRHPALADRFAPFQDLPSALDLFPAGSLVAPPSAGETTRIEVRRPAGQGG